MTPPPSPDAQDHSTRISTDRVAQGFAIVEAVLDRSEVAEFARILETSNLDRSHAGARHLMSHPAVSVVATDPRLLALARQFLGESAIPYKATLFDKSPVRNWLVVWHQDTAFPLRERREVPGAPRLPRGEVTSGRQTVCGATTTCDRALGQSGRRRDGGEDDRGRGGAVSQSAREGRGSLA